MKTKPFMRVIILGSLTLSAIVTLGQTSFPPRPQPVATSLPSYPSIARAACVQGTVGVLVTIDGTGQVKATDVLYGHPLLRRAATDAAQRWAFDAAKDDAAARREVLRFGFHISRYGTPEKKLKPVWSGATDVVIRVLPPEGSCDDCSEKRRRELSRKMCS